MHKFQGLLVASVVALVGLAGCGNSQAPAGGTISGGTAEAVIQVLSNRADLISDGDALVELVFAPGADPSKAKVTLNGSDITSAFAQRPNGRTMGLVTGLQLGRNVLQVGSSGAPGTVSIITNYPNSGPIFSGPQFERHFCQEGAVDAACNQPAQYTYLYKSSNPDQTGLLPYDPENPPDDVADTTTNEGTTLPFIVRQELGYQDRDQYKILTLFQPGMDWQPWTPQPQWNRKLLITHGGNCGASYSPGNAPLTDYSGTIPENPAFEQSYIRALGLGFAVMSTALDNTGHNCNLSLGAESIMMAKERLVEQYGELRYTIGTGCSGGSIAQATMANAYPGLYQGLLTMCAYPDTFSAGAQFADYHLLRKYFEDPTRWAPDSPWIPNQMAQVYGHLSPVNAIAADELLFKAAVNPVGDCFGDRSYHPQTNPGGVRCGIIEYMSIIWGFRDPAVWSPVEKSINKSFAGTPLGNSGIQYGLTALQQGLITPAQFVDVNAKIGGLDIDSQPQAARTKADRIAIGNVYRSGMINMANKLNTVAIINFVGPDPGAAHDSLHAWWVRWRLDREHGNHDNHIMWGGPTPLIGDPNFVYLGLVAMDGWLAAVETDTSADPMEVKLTRNKPADMHDKCSNGSGVFAEEEACIDAMQAAYAYSTPRNVAGGLRENDNLECQLKPFSREDDYGRVPLTEAQWQTLESLFADGVCDYSKPPLSQTHTVPWLTYQDHNGSAIYGGTPLPAAPERSRGGWSSPAFTY